MWKTLLWIKNNLVLTIPIAMAGGFIFGIFFDPAFLKSIILPMTILMIYPTMVTLNPREILVHCRPKTMISIQFLNLIFIPLWGYLLGLVFLKNQPYLAFGLLLIALLPTSGMTISWTGFAGGNVRIAVKVTLIGLVTGSLLMPFYTDFLMGQTIKISVGKTFVQLGKVIFIPLVLGYITQIILRKWKGDMVFNQNLKKKFPLLSSLAVLGIIFAALALKSKSILKEPLGFIYLILPVGIFYLINYFFSGLAGKFLLPRKEAVVLVYGTVLRNLSIALAIAFSVFGEKGAEIALIIAVAFVLQVQSAAWYLKIIGKYEKTSGIKNG